MKYVSLLSILCLCLSHLACDGDGTPMPNPEPAIDARSITETDANGTLTGSVDETDWTLSDEWNSRAITLFPSYGDYSFDCSSMPAVGLFPAYPNPCGDVLIFHADATPMWKVDLRIVNEDETALLSIDDQPVMSLAIDITSATTQMDTFVRLYYLFHQDDDDCALKGHGDVRLRE